MCDICQKFIRRIAQAELSKDYQAARVFRALLDGHRNTVCQEHHLVRQLWPGQKVVIREG